MRVRFIGDPRHGGEGPEVITILGLSFVKGEWTPVQGDAARRLTRHTHFEADADGDGEPGPTVESLRARLDDLGVGYHHKAGVKRLLELLEAQ